MRRPSSYDDAKLGFIISLILLVVIGLPIFFYLSCQDRSCSAKGGTYFAHEGKCVQVKEVK